MSARKRLERKRTATHVVSAATGIALSLGSTAAADECADDGCAETPAKESSTLTGNWGGLRDTLAERGLDFSLSYAAETMGNVAGGMSRGFVYNGLLTAGIDLDLAKIAKWRGAKFHVHGYDIHGKSPTGRRIGDLNVASNIDAYDTYRLVELWLEQSLWDEKFSVRLGQLAADAEFFVCDPGALFLNSAFGALPTLSLNITTPIFPQGTPGVRLAFAPCESFYVQSAVYQGDPGAQNLDGHGTHYDFNQADGAFAIAEAGFLLNPGENADGLPGAYKVGLWAHTGDTSDVATGAFHRGTYGFYAIAQQAVYRAEGSDEVGLDLFARFSAAPQSERVTATYHIDAGLNYHGLIPARAQDTLGLGVAYAHLSGDLPGPPEPDHETLVELSYRAQVTDWLKVQPDIQYIFHPGGSSALDDAFVIGARLTIDF